MIHVWFTDGRTQEAVEIHNERDVAPVIARMAERGFRPQLKVTQRALSERVAARRAESVGPHGYARTSAFVRS